MARLTPDADDQRFLRRLLFVVIAFVLAYCLYRAGNLLLLAFAAALVALMLAAIADWLADHTAMPRALGLPVAILLVLAIIGAIGWLFVDETGAQAQRLGRQLPHDWAVIRTWLGGSAVGRMLLDSGRSIAASGQVAGLALGAGWGATEILVNAVIILIGAIFFAADPALYRRGLLLLAPQEFRPSAARALDDCAIALRLWLVTQLVSMVAMGAMITAGLWASGLPSWAALGVLGGLSEFIPYVGPTLAMVPALIVALAGGGSIWGALITYAAVRIVQANIITPLVSQRVVAIPPGLYIFLILAMGFAFGTFGMFFAGALAVTAFTLVRRLYVADMLGETLPPPGHG